MILQMLLMCRPNDMGRAFYFLLWGFCIFTTPVLHHSFVIVLYLLRAFQFTHPNSSDPVAYSVGFCHPGQEMKLAPLFLIFSRKVFKNVTPQNKFRSFSKVTRKKKARFHNQTKLYVHFINQYRTFLLYLTCICQMVGLSFFLRSISAPLKWRPGHMPLLAPVSYTIAPTGSIYRSRVTQYCCGKCKLE